MKAMATVAGLTGLSRVAGFVRDILTAAILGAGPVADAFFVALKLPNLFRRVTAEGAFSVSFVPLYSEALEKQGEEEAGRFASNAFAVMLAVLSAFVLLAMAFMPFIVNVIAPGFGGEGDELRYDLAVDLSRVTFPYLLLMSLTALMGGMLNAHDRFAPFAAAPIVFNICLIGFLLFSGALFETPGHALAWGVLTAGILQFALLVYCIKKAKIVLRLVKPVLDAKIKKLLYLMGPGLIGAGVMHVNLLADMIIASFLPGGSISYLYYADRLNQLPLGIVGIAVGTALLPMLSKTSAAQNWQESRDLFNRALEVCLLLALPAAVGLFTISMPIIVTLFEHGAFDREAAAMTTAVLTAYAIGIPAYVMTKVYSASYWSRQDTVTPVKASAVAVIFNIVMSLWLVFGAGVGVMGIAAATALAGWIQIGMLAFGLRHRGETKFDVRLKRNALKIILACCAMGAALYSVKPFFTALYLEHDNLAAQIYGLAMLIGTGAVVYGTVVVTSGVVSLSELKDHLKRKAHKARKDI